MLNGKRPPRTVSIVTAVNESKPITESAGPLAFEWRISLADRWFPRASVGTRDVARDALPSSPRGQTGNVRATGERAHVPQLVD